MIRNEYFKDILFQSFCVNIFVYFLLLTGHIDSTGAKEAAAAGQVLLLCYLAMMPLPGRR